MLSIPEIFRDLQPLLTSEDVPLPQVAQGTALLEMLVPDTYIYSPVAPSTSLRASPNPT
jgi:hypothetical protein